MNRKLIISTILLLLLTGVTSWLTIMVVKKGVVRHTNKARNPDSFMVNTTYIQMDKDGEVHSTIFAPEGHHYQQNNTAIFINPDIKIYNKQQSPWHISAKLGKSENGTKIIKLIGNVTLNQAPSRHNRQLDVTTKEATVLLTKKIVRTNRLVTIKQPGLKVTAIGAIADLNRKTLKLLSHVQEVYDPTR